MKKKLLLMALCCLTIASLAACGNDTNTDATVTDAPAPTQSVEDNTTDNTDATVTEAPVATEPTAAPEETVTEAPTPTEAPKELTYAERYAVDYPFMEIEVFENVTCMDSDFYGSEIRTGYLIYFKNNGSETYTSAYGTIEPGTGFYIHKPKLDEGMWQMLYEVAAVRPATGTAHICEDVMQTCEDENCLFTTVDNNSLNTRDCTIIFYNAENVPVHAVMSEITDYADYNNHFIQKTDNQIHVDASTIGDFEWVTAKIIYEVTE